MNAAGGVSGTDLDWLAGAAALPDGLRRLQRAAEERGYRAGLARAADELDAAVRAAAALAEQLSLAGPGETARLARAIAAVSLGIARRILGTEVRADPAVLEAAIEAAIVGVNGSAEVRIYLHPAAVEPLRRAWIERHGQAYLGKRWIFEGDPTLPPGGCLFRFEHGFVDAGLETQVDEIAAALEQAVGALAVPAGVARSDP